MMEIFLIQLQIICFNPYFHGVVAAIISGEEMKKVFEKFQSLFSWSGRCNAKVIRAYQSSLSFNPYFHGVVAAI